MDNENGFVRLFRVHMETPEEQTMRVIQYLFITNRKNTSEWLLRCTGRLVGGESECQLRFAECLRAIFHCRINLCAWWLQSKKNAYHTMINPFGLGSLRWVTVPAVSVSPECQSAISCLIKGGHFLSMPHDADRDIYDVKTFRFSEQIRAYIIKMDIPTTWLKEFLSMMFERVRDSGVSEECVKQFHQNVFLDFLIRGEEESGAELEFANFYQSVFNDKHADYDKNEEDTEADFTFIQTVFTEEHTRNNEKKLDGSI